MEKMENIITKLHKDLLEIHLKHKLSIENNHLGLKVIEHYFKEIESGSPTIMRDALAAIIDQDIKRIIHDNGDQSMILDELESQNNSLRQELNRLKKSKAKPKTYKYMVRNSLGNANFNVDKLASYLNSSSVSNMAIDEFLNTATQQLINLIHTLGAKYGK